MTLAATLYTDKDLYTKNATERRDGDRRMIVAESTLRDTESRAHAITLHNLSMDGCLIESSIPLAAGSLVSIGLPGVGRREALVVRTEANRTGCRFHACLSPDQLLHAFSKENVVAGTFPNAASAAFPEPVTEKWHPALRLTILVGLTSALWSAILHIF
jgi:hypothetical protein